ncbi:MAG: TraB/GumN family protein [Halanaerobiales bacterium]
MRIRKRYILVLLILTLVVSVTTVTAKSILWEMSDEDTEIYMLGSIHLMKEGQYPLKDVIENSFEKADYLVVEADTRNVDQMALQTLIQEEGIYQDGQSLEDNLSTELYNKVTAKFKKYGLESENINPMKPWLVGLNLSQLKMLNADYDPQLGIDLYFLAKADEKEVVEMESVDFQIKMFSSFSPELQELLIKDALNDETMFKDTLNELYKYWKNGDTEKLSQLLFEQLNEMPEMKPFYDKVFFERNVNMANNIESYLDTPGTYFVILGAGHYVGDKGIVQVLKDKGYDVNQL